MTTATLEELYSRDGFVFPIDVMSREETQAARADLEEAEAELAEEADKLALLRAYTDRLLPSFDRITRTPKLVAAVQELLGPDLMVWGGGLFLKDAHSKQIVTWHQDLTYWGLDADDEVTAWVGLSPSTTRSGCMRFLPGSHRRGRLQHRDTFADNNLLTRGQEVVSGIDETHAVDVELSPGQASLHHGLLVHASGPNHTGDRRIGIAIRYIKPSMQQRSGDRSLVALVSGKDNFDHFTIAGPPRGRLHEDDLALCRMDTRIKRRILYVGADAKRGKRY